MRPTRPDHIGTNETTANTTRATAARVALVTCRDLPALDNDDHPLVDALTARAVAVEPAVWDDPAVDWAAYDLAVLRSTWDYAPRRDDFVRWAATVPRLANPASVVAWNTDKRYLDELATAGAPVVPTTWQAPGDAWRPPARGEVVVKPAVGAGSIDTGRYNLADPAQRDLAAALATRLGAAGRTVMVQPYLAAVDTVGETALLWLGGRYSHAIRKGALLTGPDTGVDGLYREETITPREPDPAELAAAARVLAAMPFDVADLLYVRVDLIPGPDSSPLLLELELTEPSLFLTTAPGAAERLADAIGDRVAGRCAGRFD